MADAQRTITVTAPTEPQLLAALAVLRAECAARRAVLQQVTDIRRYPGGVFVRVRPRVPVSMPAPAASRGLRGRTRLSLAAAVVVLVLGVLGALVFFLVGHWRLLVGVVVVVGVLAVLFAGNGKSRSGPA